MAITRTGRSYRPGSTIVTPGAAPTTTPAQTTAAVLAAVPQAVATVVPQAVAAALAAGSRAVTVTVQAAQIPADFAFKTIGRHRNRKIDAAKQAAKVNLRKAQAGRGDARTIPTARLLLTKVGWVFVGNLPPTIGDKALGEYFSRVAGPVGAVSIRVSGPPQPGRTHATKTYRYAMVSFAGDELQAARSVQMALLQHGVSIPGDKEYAGFRLVVTDQPTALPEIVAFAKERGAGALVGAKGRHGIKAKKVAGQQTAAGLRIPNSTAAVQATQIWSPVALGFFQRRQDMRDELLKGQEREPEREQENRPVTMLTGNAAFAFETHA